MNRSLQENEQEKVSEEGLDDIVNPFEGSHRRMTSNTALKNTQLLQERQQEDKSFSSIESNSMKSRSKNSQEVPEQEQENNQSYRFDQSGVMLTQQDDDDLDGEEAEKLLLANEPGMKLVPKKSLIITPTPEREKSNKSSKIKDSQDLEISDKAYSSPVKRELTKEVKEENEIEFQPFRRNFAQKVQEEDRFNKLFSQANPTIVDSSQDFNQSTQFEDEHDTMLRSNAIDIAEIDTQDLELQELNIERLNKQTTKTRFQKQRRLENDIEKTHLLTNTKLQKRKSDLEKVLEQKELNSVMNHSKKEEVLRSNFSDAVRRLINNVKFQKDSILSSYGPLVLQSKKKESSIFDVYDLKDSKQSKAYRDLLKLKNKIPQPIQVKIVTARCLKDKVGSGSYIVKCSVMDRLGGSKIKYDLAEYEDIIRSVSQNLREHNRKKRAFINTEHRDLEHKTVGGRKVFLTAPKTGANWFKAGQANQGFDIFNQRNNQMKDIEEEKEARDQQSQQQEQRIDPEKDIKLEFTRIHSRFLRFDARYSDNDLFVNDEVNILIPPSPETSNILLFELILLASDTVPKDYVVGWGVFPLLNSEFSLNEGKFKTPLLFGNINKSFDKFGRIEQQVKQDLDNWLCNLYIEMEKIQMSDIKVDVETKELYFSPLSKKKTLPSERGSRQRSVKNSTQKSLSDRKEDDLSVSDIYDKTSVKKFKSPAFNLDQDASSSESQDEREEEKQISQRQSVLSGLYQQSSVHLPSARLSKSPSEAIVANEAVYQFEKTNEDIQLDQYQFSVCQKLDHRTKRLTFKKVNYIMDEVLADLRLKKFKSIEFHLAWVYIFFLFYLRIFTHYIGQYIILNAMGVPVTRFEPHWYKIKVEYAPWMFTQDLLVVGAGLVMNIIVFVFFALVAFSVKRMFNWFPRIFFQVICWNGIMTILNPFLVLLFDLFSQSWSYGDYFKFYNYFYEKGGNGLAGIYLTFFYIIGFTIINGFLFYNYMIFIHMNGRILDLYKRLSGSIKSFFIPHDNEVSIKYLQWVVQRAQKNDYIMRSTKQQARDKKGRTKQLQFVYFYKYDDSCIRRNRLFVKYTDGSICEVPQNKIELKIDEVQSLKADLESGKANGYGNAGQMLDILNRSLRDSRLQQYSPDIELVHQQNADLDRSEHNMKLIKSNLNRQNSSMIESPDKDEKSEESESSSQRSQGADEDDARQDEYL